MTVILKKTESFSREDLRGLLAENSTLLEQGLELLGGELGLRGEILWDLVGIDDRKRLVLIGIALNYNDTMLYQVVKRVDWAWEHIEHIAKMYSSVEIDCSHLPRVIMVAPFYSHFFKKGITYLTSQFNISLFTYSCLESTGERGIFIERCR